jgi:menaquinone-dependent protoporphyrinogen IX oxidase
MKKLVVYESGTGFTKQYAEWIAQELSCSAVSLKQTTAEEVKQNDLVIFGGWIMGGMVCGLDKVLAMAPAHLIAFGVGSTPAEITDAAAMKQQNHLENVPFFYFVGGFRFEKLNFVFKIMLKTLKKSVVKKADKTPQEKFMADILGTSFDATDKKYMEPLLACVKETEAEVK